MNIYPPLLPAPGFPYLCAGKILPASQPWGRGGAPSLPSQSRGRVGGAEGFSAAGEGE